MFFHLFPLACLFSFSLARVHQAGGGEETKSKTREMTTTVYGVPVVLPVSSETAAEVYECVHDADPADANYTWYRQDWPALPEGTKAEGNRLHFTRSTSDLNGMYGCIIINEKGTFVASFYRNIQENPLDRIVKSVTALWMQTLSLLQ